VTALLPDRPVVATSPGRHAAGRPSSAGRILGLDGLRAVAVTAVVIYHLGNGSMTGGFLGVDLFFVISGFLITTLLLEEIGLRGRVDIGAFYLRRARRLLPALVLMLLGTALIVTTIARDSASQFLRDLPGAALYISNWWALGQEQSYFELIGRGNMLGHLWSLAVEEQFYLLWPLMLTGIAWFAARRGWARRPVVLAIALGGALLSTAWMAALAVSRGYPIDADPTRVYFGTDTHAMSILVGAALAAVWRPSHYARTIPAGARTMLTAVGAGGLAVSVLLFVTVSEYTPWLYRGGFLLAAAVFAVVIAAGSHPGAPLGRWLDNPPMRWIGERSYGIYLWHYPVFLVTRPGIDVPWEGAWFDGLRIALVVGVAELSYRYVETPIRRGALGRAWQRARERSRELGPVEAAVPTHRRTWVLLGTASAVAAILVAGFTQPLPDAQTQAIGTYGSTTAISDDTSAPAEPGARPSSSPVAGTSAKPAAKPTPLPSATKPAPQGKAPVTGLTTADISWYGDSVTLWSAPVLRKYLPGVKLDAAINRSPANIEGAVLASRARGTLGSIVVMHLGTAGPVDEGALESTIAKLSGTKRIVLVTSTARFAWVKPSNRVLADVAARHSNVVLADWAAFSAGKAQWFEDGLHLTAQGKPYFAKLVRKKALDLG
jgi:peptidoglycan/LPS O-acetylase OafA/YrhL